MFSVLIPVKNEPNLTPFLLRLHKVLENIPDEHEVLIIQGDRETGFNPYEQIPYQKTIWTYADSLERSILNGFSHAKGDRIIIMDSDGSHPPEKIPELYRALDKYDMAVGSRFVEGAEFKPSIIRQFVTSGCKYLAWFAGSSLSDPMSGLFAFRRELLYKIRFKPFTWKICLEIELKAQPSILEIPIHFVERSMGFSKTTLKTGLKILFELAFIGVTGKL